MRSVLLVSLGVFVSACGGSGSSPASPTPSQPTVLAITIVGPAVVPTGSSETYSVTAILSNGAKVNNATPTTWSIDNASVATIDDNGVLTVRGRGTATITATHQGRNATATVRVPVDNDNPGGANLVISFRPDPVPGSLAPCTGAFWAGQTPSWSMDEVFNETQGVGFTVKLEILNLYNQDGALIYHFSFPEVSRGLLLSTQLRVCRGRVCDSRRSAERLSRGNRGRRRRQGKQAHVCKPRAIAPGSRSFAGFKSDLTRSDGSRCRGSHATTRSVRTRAAILNSKIPNFYSRNASSAPAEDRGPVEDDDDR